MPVYEKTEGKGNSGTSKAGAGIVYESSPGK